MNASRGGGQDERESRIEFLSVGLSREDVALLSYDIEISESRRLVFAADSVGVEVEQLEQEGEGEGGREGGRGRDFDSASELVLESEREKERERGRQSVDSMSPLDHAQVTPRSQLEGGGGATRSNKLFEWRKCTARAHVLHAPVQWGAAGAEKENGSVGEGEASEGDNQGKLDAWRRRRALPVVQQEGGGGMRGGLGGAESRCAHHTHTARWRHRLPAISFAPQLQAGITPSTPPHPL